MTNVDLCETERDRAFAINAEAPSQLAEICGDKRAKLIHFSTDYVFDGTKREPYTEEDVAKPISAYGESKLAGERNVLGTVGDAASVPSRKQTASPTDSRAPLVVRVSWVFGPDRPSFIDGVINRARQEDHIDAIADKISTPTYTLDIARMLPRFFDTDVAGGILHFANAGECSWQEYAQYALDCSRSAGLPLKAKSVAPLTMADMTRLRQGSGGQARARQGQGGQRTWVARRPVYSVLSTAKFFSLNGAPPRTWRDAVGDYIRHFYPKK
jgi:dTDP-4-dehydrorhamnose reductase